MKQTRRFKGSVLIFRSLASPFLRNVARESNEICRLRAGYTLRGEVFARMVRRRRGTGEGGRLARTERASWPADEETR